ncbi:hypothetical protein HELRODRAFT_158228 [Helobdella robusta]|uniref:Intraflagellar transport protein 80 homolog n=1 Tax=Helobdella robusta TaxID=6412 RepID=T1EMK9_HELRO|nr:hypothetical protein HELRODRAFT_158228 [Helobdella robusta]ESO09780.1 hypothetical protein HELRODRAFT_158228 [Helobdella robusta]
MKLKIVLKKSSKNFDLVGCVCWCGPDEVYSAGDNHEITKWNLATGEHSLVAKLPDDFYPTDIKCAYKSANTKQQSNSNDVLAIGSTDGRLMLMSRNGRVEKLVEAHLGAIPSLNWNHEGTDLITGGEDGQLKIWSRSGMLRSTLRQSSCAVHSVAWSSSCDHVLYASDRQLTIKPIQTNVKNLNWKAHEGLILCVDWNHTNNLIISGAEDCKYKIWDSYGRIIYTSSSHEHPITSLSWSPSGHLFVVGAFNLIRLCDKLGWSHSLDKPSSGSLYNLCWSRDGTQVVGGAGGGAVLFARLSDWVHEWQNLEIQVSGAKAIQVRNISNDARDHLEVKDRIINTSIRYKYLIVVTSSKCYVYSVNNWHTPAVEFELKECIVSMIQQSHRYFMLLNSSSINIFSYDGRLVSSPKSTSLNLDPYNRHAVVISDDVLVIRDKLDEKTVYVFETVTGKMTEVMELGLEMSGKASDRKMTVVDRNRDLHIIVVRGAGSPRRVVKVGRVVESLCWHDDRSMFACISESQVIVFVCPSAGFIDRSLMEKAVIVRDASEYGKNPQIQSFHGNNVQLKRGNGSMVSCHVTPYAGMLLECVEASKWEEAVKLCRFVNTEAMWACLAALATNQKNLNTAEVAYAALNEPEKVKFLQHIKQETRKEVQSSELALFSNNVHQAEGILIQSGLIFRAIMLNVNLFQWERALELSLKHKTHIDTVIGHRQQYLNKFGKKETNKYFIQNSEGVKVNWETIKAKMQAEYQNEKSQ